jgi:parvulin-like peptidyl-prolyl isomerase
MAKTPTQKITTKKHLARQERERIQRRWLLGITIAVMAIVVLIIGYGILDQSVLRMNKTVAKIGAQKITVGEFQDEVRFTRYRYIEQLTNLSSNQLYAQFFGSYIQQLQDILANNNSLGKQILDELVNDRLIAMEAEVRGITVSDAEVEEAKQEYFSFYPNGTPTPAPTSAPFATATLDPTQESWLPPTATPQPTATLDPALPTATATVLVEPTATPDANAAPTVTPTAGPTETPFPTATPYTEEGYQGVLTDYLARIQDVAYSEAQFTRYFYRQLLREKVVEALTADLPRESEFVWARHILVASQEEAQAVIDRLNAGEDWVKLASELSTDTSNKDSGGDMSWFTTGAMVPEFEAAAFALQIGEVSQPVETSFGFHIIQLLGREIRPLSDSEYQTKQSAAFDEWLTAQKTEKNVEIFDDVWSQNVPEEPAVPLELQTVQ